MASYTSTIYERFENIVAVNALSSLWTLKLLLVTIALSLGFYYFLTKKPKVEKKRIPGPKVNGIITNIVPLLSIFKNNTVSKRVLFFQVICGYSHVFRKEGMWLFWGGLKQILILYKAETVEPVLNSNEILSKGFEYEFITPMLKEGLLTSTKKKWRYRRKLLTPSFHFRILDEFIPVFNEQAKIFSTKLAEAMHNNEWINIAPLTSLCTLDIICETAMGKKINAQGNSTSPYVQALHKICKAATDRILRPWLWPDFIYYRTKEGKSFKNTIQIMDAFTRQVVTERKEEILKERKEGKFLNEDSADGEELGVRYRRRLALLDSLIDLHLKDETFTLEDIAEEVDNFMFAVRNMYVPEMEHWRVKGHDTTSSGLSWALYMLGLHPAIQKKVQQELDDVLGDDPDKVITLDDIKELKYLDCVLKETRRLLPPTPFIARDLEEDTDINGYTIPKGTSCGILIYMLHRDPDVFPNPEVFDPDRFLLRNTSKRHPFAYVPFSAGPRNCIGQRFAIFEGITVMATILRKFDITALEPLDKVHVVDELVLRSENGLRMTIKPREKSE